MIFWEPTYAMQANQQMLLDSDEEDPAALEVPKPNPNRSDCVVDIPKCFPTL